jgi:polysaccharide export outer membrane protein
MNPRASGGHGLQCVRTGLWVISIFTCLALGGCVGWDIDELNRTIRVAPTADPPVSGVDPTALHLLNASAAQRESIEYLLGPGDVLHVGIHQLDTLGEERQLTLTVAEGGTVTLPLIGDVQADGLTADELAERIRRGLGEDFIRDPRVKVEVAEYRSRVATVMGAVNAPGRYPILGKAMSLMDLLGQAGGITERADDEVHIVRGALATGGPAEGGKAAAAGQPVVVRLSHLVRQGMAQGQVLVYPGDLVTVSQRGASNFYVSGHVMRPGSYNRTTNMTLLQALTVAGGLADTADPQSLKIIRQQPTGGEELIEVDLKRIAAGTDSDVRILAADLIVVPTTPGRRAQAEVRRFFSRLISVGVDARYNAVE